MRSSRRILLLEEVPVNNRVVIDEYMHYGIEGDSLRKEIQSCYTSKYGKVMRNRVSHEGKP